MEFVHDLVLTASLALLFSFIVAKLVSLAMADDSPQTGNAQTRAETAAFLGEEEEIAMHEHDKADEAGSTSVLIQPQQSEISCSDCGGEEDGTVERIQSELGTEVAEEVIEESDAISLPEQILEVSKNEEEECGVVVDCFASGEKVGNTGKDEVGLRGEDDWEGIERSQLNKVFDVAARFVEGEGKDELLANASSVVQMQLYGLHKIATEGPCYEPQPMALKVSARAKWNAWQKLGNMSPEEAMEQYVAVLSDNVPCWMHRERSGGHNSGAVLGVDSNADCGTPSNHQQSAQLKAGVEGGADTGGRPNSMNRGKD